MWCDKDVANVVLADFFSHQRGAFGPKRLVDVIGQNYLTYDKKNTKVFWHKISYSHCLINPIGL